MNIYQAFNSELEKVGVKAGDITFHNVHANTKAEYKKNLTPVLKKSLHPILKPEHKRFAGAFAKKDSKFLSHIKRRNPEAYGGYAYPGSKHATIINRQDHPPHVRRNILAHEAFHAKHPILGRSEVLAHAYGGWRAPRHGSLLTRAKSSMNWLFRGKASK